MKLTSIITLLSLGLFMFNGCTNVKKNTQPPEVVLNSLHTLFSSASSVSWVNDQDVWEASFEIDNLEYEVSFNELGEWVETEQELEISNMPEKIALSIEASFPDHTIIELEKNTSHERTLFEIDLEKDGSSIEIEMSSSGKILSQE